MLSREDFSRRHQRRLSSAFDDADHGERRDDGLAGADVALHETQHARVRAEVGANVGERPLLRAGEAERQSGFDHLGNAAVAFVLAPGQATHFRAREAQRQLRRQQFVEGETLARGMLRRQGFRAVGPMRGAQRVSKGRQPVRRHHSRLLPFGQGGDTGQSLFRRA